MLNVDRGVVVNVIIPNVDRGVLVNVIISNVDRGVVVNVTRVTAHLGEDSEEQRTHGPVVNLFIFLYMSVV